MPDFPENSDLLYGVLSQQIHNPYIVKVVVSDLSDSNYKSFFKQIGKSCSLGFREYDEEASLALADEEEI